MVTNHASRITAIFFERDNLSDLSDSKGPLAQEISEHYSSGYEEGRLSNDLGQLEFLRTQEILTRYLPPPPAVVLDVGGGPGAYSCWLARLGYETHLIDGMPLHVEQSRRASESQPDHPIASLAVGDARNLDIADGFADAVLLLGPLYHLTEREDRIRAIAEAGRVARHGAVIIAVVISRFASTFDGLFRGYMDDPEFVSIAERDLRDGQHRNPNDKRAYFTTAYFHHPAEILGEMEEAGLKGEEVLPVEGPAWLLQNFSHHWQDAGRRSRLLDAIRRIEDEPSLIGVSAHIITIARKQA